MRVSVSGHHVDVTPALRDYVEKKLTRVMRRFDRMIQVHCILSVDKLRHKAESTIFVRGTTLYAESTDGDMYAAIDALADKLDRRVRKHKERVRDHHAFEAQKHGPVPAQ
ncbi:MAG: ribosome-associated translation inhibitor RaiA [Gammaproteobacteria bacterium]|nr:ribosome-associated translation inhibitor RaiA [Gammaproteobacteria bacterium]